MVTTVRERPADADTDGVFTIGSHRPRPSRAGAVALAVGCVLAVFAQASAAASFPLSIPAPAQGTPRVLAAGEEGASVVVWATDSVYQGYGALTVDTIGAGPDPVRSRWSARRSLLAGSARDRAGNLDLLTMVGANARSTDEPRLVLYRARQNGGVRRVWSGGAGWQAAVARRGKRLAIAWIKTVAGRRGHPPHVVLRLVTSPDGKRFSRPRTINDVLPSTPDADDPGFVNDLALTLDPSGQPVVALTAPRRRAYRLVLASLTAAGRVRTRQLTRGVDGLVQAETTVGGRVVVVVEDTGIEGEGGECVADQEPRKIFATVREPRASRFEAVVLLHSGPYSCADAAARLVTNDTDQPAVLWGSAPETPPSAPIVKLAIARRGKAFAPPVTIASGAMLRTATYHGGGMLLAVTTRPVDPDYPYGGPLVLQAITSGSGVGPFEPVDPAGASVVLSDTTDDGTNSLVAWLPTGSRDLRLNGFGGQ